MSNFPTLSMPTYEKELPLSHNKVKYRPFTVKEEHSILIETDENNADVGTVMTSIYKLIDVCTFGVLDLDSIPLVDIEYLFALIRTKSKGELTEVLLECKHLIPALTGIDVSVPGHACGHRTAISLNVEDVYVVGAEVERVIMLQDDIGFKMKFPTSTIMANINSLNDNAGIDQVYDLYSQCVECVFHGEEAIVIDDTNRANVVGLLENTTKKQLSRVKVFFDNQPKCKLDADFECGECGHSEQITFTGLKNFLK